MNYRTQLERLHNQFLQVTSVSHGRAAMLQGANIVMAAMKEGSLPQLDGIEKLENEIRTTQKGFEYVAEIQEYCFAWYAMKVTKNEAFRRMGVTDDTTTFSAMYAAFCLEIIDMLESNEPGGLTPHPYKLYYLEYIEKNKGVRYPGAAAAKAYFNVEMDKKERGERTSKAGNKNDAIQSFVRSFKRLIK